MLQTDLVNDLPVPVTARETGHTGYWELAPAPAFPDGPNGEVPAGKTVSIWMRPVTCYFQQVSKRGIGAGVGMEFSAGAGDPVTPGYSLDVIRTTSQCGRDRSRTWHTNEGKWNLKTSPPMASLRYTDPATGTEKVATITGTNVAERITPPPT